MYGYFDAAVQRLFSVKRLLGRQEQRGALPTSREMYLHFFRIAWPSVVEAVLVGLVGVVDSMMVSVLGDTAISAVGITSQPKFVLLCTIISLNVGLTAVVARRRGQNDREGANRALRNGLQLAAIIIAVLSFLGYTFAEPFLRFAGAKPEYLSDAVTYFRIIVISIVFQGFNLVINAAQRGCGNTRLAMTTNMVGNLVNIVFNYLLINGIGPFPRWGIRGAGIATMMGTMVACGLSLAKLLRRDNYLNLWLRAPWRLSGEVLHPIAKVSSSAFIEQICLRVGFFTFNKLLADLGTLEYTTHIICMNFLSLSFCFGDGFQIAASALVGQNLGAKRPDKAYIFCRIGQRIVFFVSLGICLCFVLFREPLLRLYSDTPQVVQVGCNIMYFMAVITYLQTAQVVYTGCLRGAGDTRFTAMISFLAITIVRPTLGYLLAYAAGFGLYGAWSAILIDQGVRLVLSYGRFMHGKWMRISL